ncbi:unnamed protein product, partial [Phaeothamnion confervicola]
MQMGFGSRSVLLAVFLLNNTVIAFRPVLNLSPASRAPCRTCLIGAASSDNSRELPARYSAWDPRGALEALPRLLAKPSAAATENNIDASKSHEGGYAQAHPVAVAATPTPPGRDSSSQRTTEPTAGDRAETDASQHSAARSSIALVAAFRAALRTLPFYSEHGSSPASAGGSSQSLPSSLPTQQPPAPPPPPPPTPPSLAPGQAAGARVLLARQQELALQRPAAPRLRSRGRRSLSLFFKRRVLGAFSRRNSAWAQVQAFADRGKSKSAMERRTAVTAAAAA